MIVADKLKNTNRAEYLLYMWQVEDLIRSFHCDEELIAEKYVSTFNLDERERKRVSNWYANLCEMMRTEGIRKAGHLQICQNILQELDELNAKLLASPAYYYYKQLYCRVLPYIVELRERLRRHYVPKGEEVEESELTTCFDFLYGVIMLRLQKKEISEDTAKAVTDISKFLGQLSDYYFLDKKEGLKF